MMKDLIPIKSCQVLFLLLQILAGTSVLMVEGDSSNGSPQNVSTVIRDDLSTEWAKEIIRRAKTADIHGVLDTKVSPCDNFYQYACGNWYRSYPAQLLSNIMTDRFQMIAKAFDRRLEKILKEPTTNVNTDLENKLKKFYKSCLAVRRNDLTYKLVLENVYKEYGSLPFLVGNDWKADEFNWWETVAKIQNKYGNQIILAIEILGDIKNNNVTKIYIGPPEYNNKLMSILQEPAIIKGLQLFFGVESKAATKIAQELVRFERELVQGGSEIRVTDNHIDDFTLAKVEDLNTTYQPQIDVKKYIELVLGSNAPESIYIYNEKYFNSTLKTIDATPKHIVANYILWQLLQDYFIENKESNINKWCIDTTKKHFAKFVDYSVYKRFKSEKMEQEIQELWEEVRTTFRDNLRGNKLDWMASKTREDAIGKLDAMKLYINSYENENFTELLGPLEVDSFSYIQNIQNIRILESRKKLLKLHETAPALEAPEILATTPTYNVLENTIKIPVVLLQPRFLWDDNYPMSLKYSTFGYLIAHEMLHGFDDDGRNYDEKGNLIDWWDRKSIYEFDEKRKCFQAQYHLYKYGGKRLPDTLSQSENIADNGGIKLAFATYLRWLNNQKINDTQIEAKERLPGLAFDNRQLFFVSFAQLWCSDVQTLFKTSVLASDTHAPAMYRVIGSLSNFQEFSWVFQCKQDAPMDPEYKCSIY